MDRSVLRLLRTSRSFRGASARSSSGRVLEPVALPRRPQNLRDFVAAVDHISRNVEPSGRPYPKRVIWEQCKSRGFASEAEEGDSVQTDAVIAQIETDKRWRQQRQEHFLLYGGIRNPVGHPRFSYSSSASSSSSSPPPPPPPATTTPPSVPPHHQSINSPDATNPDPVTLQEQWRYATRMYSMWYAHAWGTAILAGLTFYGLGWFIKGENPLKFGASPKEEEAILKPE